MCPGWSHQACGRKHNCSENAPHEVRIAIHCERQPFSMLGIPVRESNKNLAGGFNMCQPIQFTAFVCVCHLVLPPFVIFIPFFISPSGLMGLQPLIWQFVQKWRIASSVGHHSFTPRCLVGGCSGTNSEKLKSPPSPSVLPTGAPLLREWAARETLKVWRPTELIPEVSRSVDVSR